MDLYLISQELKHDKTVPYSNQVLHLAMILSSIEHFQHLLQLYSAHINDQDPNGNTILHVAVINKKLTYISILYQYDVDDTLINHQHKLAADYCDDSIFGINLKQTILNYQNTYKLQCIQQLHTFASQGQLNSIKSLMTPKCINSIDFNQLYKGNTLVHICVLDKRVSTLQYLLQYCDPLIRNEEGLLPIDYCHHSTEDKEMAALLKQQMAITPKLTNKNEMSGVLLKYTNIANGYKSRWFILKNYHLYYKKYKQQHHYRGKLHVNQLKLIPDISDVKKFVIQSHAIKWHLKAEYGSEAQKWVLHILQAQKSYKDISSPTIQHQLPVINDMDTVIMKIADAKASLMNDFNLLKELIIQYHTSHDPACFNALCAMVKEYENHLILFQNELLTKDQCYQSLLAQERQAHLWTDQPLPLTSPENIELSNMDLNKSSEPSPSKSSELNYTPSNESSDDEFYDAVSALPNGVDGYNFQFREHLPVDHLLLQNEVSIISILKDAIGKDLTRITLPVYFNEPISMLQRLCEEIEYASLLDMAVKCTKQEERLSYVAAYAMSSYASTVDRLGKPFNPLLGETFEYCHGFKYISEQVSHHPPISACHCQGNDWVFYSEADVKSQFGGTSLSIIPKGDAHVVLTIDGKEEHYSWRKLTTTVNNLLLGRMYIDHHGDMEIKSHAHDSKAILHFKQAGWRLKNYQEVTGELFIGTEEIGEFQGKWNDKLQLTRHNETKILWKYNKVDLNKSDFNLTPFAMTLNELNPELKALISPTDCRLRPDQRAMEEGRYDVASTEKNRLEEKQRAARKTITNYEPKWFKRDVSAQTGNPYWKFTDEYWQKREERDWNGCMDLF